MDVHVAFSLFFILDLFSHGISVPLPVYPNYYDNMQNQGYQISDDTMETDTYERYPRDTLPNPNFWHQYPWYTRSSIPSHPRPASRRHFHLFHLTSKHPNAVSYHVIEKPHAAAKTTSRQKVESNPRRSNLYNNGGWPYPPQSYYQQPQPNYQYPGYPQNQYGVQNGGGFHDSTYDDILDVVSKPMQIGNKIIPPYHGEGHQNDQARTTIEEAAKQFKLASADMSNMELASLVMYPVPRFRVQSKVHKKKSKTKHIKKHHDKKVETKAKEEENEGKKVTNLVDNLIKTNEKSAPHEATKAKDNKENDIDQKEKEVNDEGIKDNKNDRENDQEENGDEGKTKENKKEKDDNNGNKEKENDDDVKEKEDDGMYDKESAPKDSWAEEEISSRGVGQFTSSKRSKIQHAFDKFPSSDDKYISSKRSEIPHAFDEISNSDEDADSEDEGDLNVKKSESDKDDDHVSDQNDKKENDEEDHTQGGESKEENDEEDDSQGGESKEENDEEDHSQGGESKEESDETQVDDDKTEKKSENTKNENQK
ncbi:sarcoplasmic reticulum histidine-rich calcium-binding protein-like [Dendronephthya gigantea]|uniref:sarcoplasmic reticulum histidine-rich calcium-binding protein-like n=1 Tax=Dendronephthya gigantea TaxID=151771 RepID=UPI001069DAAC|nr:sarcoplasmic reticulum histidine-rich calcium-binding protein-like [Dendronephthya gigantea]